MRIYRDAKSDFYYFDGRDAGLGRFSLKTTSKKVAENYLTRKKMEILEGRLEIPTHKKKFLTLHEAFEKFLEHCKTKLKTRTYIRYRLSSRTILQFFDGEFPVNELKPLHIEEYKQHRLKQNRKPATVNRDLQFLRNMYNRLIAWELVSCFV